MRKINGSFVAGIIIALICVSAGLSSSANAQARKVKANYSTEPAVQQPLYSEYKGIRLGMTADETRAKLGAPMLKADDGDFYIFSDKETLQLVYDVDHKVKTISVDYTDGIGAPDYKTVVGGELEMTSSGGLYKMRRYDSQGFWVTYHRSAGPVVIVTVTIGKM